MKCPFRTITTKAPLYANGGSVTTVEYAECIKGDCPYWGKKVLQHRAEGGFRNIIEPICRRANDE